MKKIFLTAILTFAVTACLSFARAQEAAPAVPDAQAVENADEAVVAQDAECDEAAPEEAEQAEAEVPSCSSCKATETASSPVRCCRPACCTYSCCCCRPVRCWYWCAPVYRCCWPVYRFSWCCRCW